MTLAIIIGTTVLAVIAAFAGGVAFGCAYAAHEQAENDWDEMREDW